MNSTELRIFEVVARCGSMVRAARELGTVQSNVTTRVLALEEKLRAPLFHRHARGVTLTRAGERLLPYAAQVTRLLREAANALDDGEPGGALVLGTHETTAAVRMAPVLARYRKQHPAVDLTLRTGSSAALVDEVLRHQLEGAFVAGRFRHPQLVEEPVFSEELVLVSAPSRRTLDAALSCESAIVFRAGCSYRKQLEGFLWEERRLDPRRLEFGTLEGILGCVSADLGISMLPKSVVKRSRNGRVKAHALPRRWAWVETSFVSRADVVASSALVAFVRCAKREWRTSTGSADEGSTPARAR